MGRPLSMPFYVRKRFPAAFLQKKKSRPQGAGSKGLDQLAA